LIIQKGIKKVVIAMKDPNPLVSGRGIRRLRQAGIAVVVGILENEARQLNRFFVNHIRTGLPYVHLKITQTSDGFIARNRRKLQYITCYPSRRLVHKWRSAHDAVLVGAGTIKADDPRLDVRLVKGRNPAVVILDGKLSVKGSERVFSSADGRNVFLCTCRSAIESHRKTSESLQKKGVVVLQFSENKKKLDLHQILKRLYAHNIGSVLVEGGSIVFTEFLLKGCVDELSVFVSPQEYGTGVPAFSDGGKSLKSLQSLVSRGHLSTSFVGDDLLLSGTFR
jgi:diaminohydroxyphosphoribosylaminopyrimidine deaminase/5-amino-6-(5-phosphoribosylamino)uracil reductase